jgi:hypothetical protein
MANRDFPLAPSPETLQDSTNYFRNKVKNINVEIKKETKNLPYGKSSNPKDGQKMRDLVSQRDKLISNQLRQSRKRDLK